MEIKKISKKFGEQIILIDDSDFELIKDYSLSLFKYRNNLYIRTSWINGKRFLLHRFIMNAPDNLMVDHINHNTLDNRRSNLRICTNQENRQNSIKHKISKRCKYKGVYRMSDEGKYYATIRFENKNIYLGTFENIIDAAKSYNKSAIEFFGEYANLNKIE